MLLRKAFRPKHGVHVDVACQLERKMLGTLSKFVYMLAICQLYVALAAVALDLIYAIHPGTNFQRSGAPGRRRRCAEGPQVGTLHCTALYIYIGSSLLHKPIEEMVSLCDGSDCFDCSRVRRNQTLSKLNFGQGGVGLRLEAVRPVCKEDVELRFLIVCCFSTYTYTYIHTYSHSEITRDKEYIQTQICTDLHIHTRYISIQN